MTKIRGQMSVYETRTKTAESTILGKRARKSLDPPSSTPSLELLSKAIDAVVMEVTKKYGPFLEAAKKDKEKYKGLEKKSWKTRKSLREAQTG